MHITLIYNNKDFVVFDKPAGLPSAPLNEADKKDTALSQICSMYPKIASVVGRKNIEGGLIHRIDTATRGLLLAAKTQETFDYFQKEQAEGRFFKYYTAICINKKQYTTTQQCILRKPPFSITSKFRSFGPHHKMVDPVSDKSGKAAQKKAGKKYYTTEVLEITKYSNKILENLKLPFLDEKLSQVDLPLVFIKCRINQGFRHQVRSHLSWEGYPIIGDTVYGLNNNLINQMQFFATELEFFPPENILLSSAQKNTSNNIQKFTL